MTPRELADQICTTLRQGGHQAYLVGGCVRDLLLGREPADYDVSTDARPERVQQLFPRSVAVGAKFGVVLVLEQEVAEDPAQVEVATFRSDIGYSDGRHPGPRRLFRYPARRRAPPRFHNQWPDDGSRHARSARFCGWPRRSARRNHSRHRRSARAFCRRQAAHDARRALCRAFQL